MDDVTDAAAAVGAYRHAVAQALQLLDHLAVVEPHADAMERCASNLEEAVRAVRTLPVLPEDATIAPNHPRNPRFEPAERGLTPSLWVDAEDETQMVGRVCFSPRFGGAAAVHGGAISLFFDDVLGMTAHKQVKDAVARTAYLKVDYRSLAPLVKELSCRVWIERIEGRKLFVRGEIRDASRLIAEAEGLWVVPRVSPASYI